MKTKTLWGQEAKEQIDSSVGCPERAHKMKTTKYSSVLVT
jgi:hypothetical protein